MKNLLKPALVALLAAPLLLPFAAHAQQNPPNMEDIMKAMNKMLAPGTNSAALVDFHELKALLPPALEGMKRTNASGEKTGAVGMSVAYAEATYESESSGRIDIKITDMSGTGGMLAMSHGWMATEIDRESDTGYEKTSMMGANKAYEKYDTGSKDGQVQIMVKDRFMVEVEGSGVTMESIKTALGKIDLEKLASLKPAGGSAPAPAAK